MEALRLIDFEYSNYGYRGFEFGNHFCEWMYDYTNPEAPYYYHNPEHWPTYGITFNDECNGFDNLCFQNKSQASLTSTWNMPTRVQRVMNLLPKVTRGHMWFLWTEQIELLGDLTSIKADDFALVSHIYWMLWSFVQAEVSDIQFGYREYALVRHKSYLQLRQQIKDSNNNANWCTHLIFFSPCAHAYRLFNANKDYLALNK